MDLGIAGRVCLVMGAGGGLGRGIAQSLAAEGAIVAGGGVTPDHLHETGRILAEDGHSFLPVVADLRRPETLADAVAKINHGLGPISILVNNSGGPAPGPAAGVELEAWKANFADMAASLFYLTDLVLPDMRSQRWGRVITSTSSGVIAPIANLALSNTVRASVIGWSKTLAGEVAKDGITVNVVVPGRIDTDRVRMLDAARAAREGRSADDVASQSVTTIPVGRYGRTSEYGDCVAFLASERASYVTGSIMRVDGGMLANI
jgi:3-oxoacyl-[acyl-carrier protein] reductase